MSSFYQYHLHTYAFHATNEITKITKLNNYKHQYSYIHTIYIARYDSGTNIKNEIQLRQTKHNQTHKGIIYKIKTIIQHIYSNNLGSCFSL
jgi:hypothetical protein